MVSIDSSLVELITDTIETLVTTLGTNLLSSIGSIIFGLIGKFVGDEFANSAVIILLTLIFVGTGAMVVKRASS